MQLCPRRMAIASWHYQCLFDAGLSANDVEVLRLATCQQETWGYERFRLLIETPVTHELAVLQR